MYVVDASDGKVYTYNMPDASDARLASLSLSDVDIGEFSSRPDGVRGRRRRGTSRKRPSRPPGGAAPQASVAIDPPDADGNEVTNGHQVALEGAQMSSRSR